MSGLRIHFAGVGGQGTQTASRILGEAAIRADVHVYVAALHGMAQRGGSVTNQVLLGDVRSPVIEPAEADMLVGFEPIETARGAPLLKPGGVAIVSTSRIVPSTLTASGNPYPEVDAIHAQVQELAGRFFCFDGAALAQTAGNVKAVGPVMLGAIAGTGLLPFGADVVRATLDDVSAESRRAVNLAAFDQGARAVS